MTNIFLHDGEMPEEIAAEMKRKSKPEMIYDAGLAFGLDFTPDDLIANRAGLISDRQVAFLRKIHRRTQTILYVATTVFLVLLVFIPGFQLLRKPAPTQAELATAPVLLGPLYFLFLCSGQASSPRFVSDLDNLQTSVIESLFGQVFLDTRGNISELRIGAETFRLEEGAYIHFRHLDSYTIYYVPGSKVILSAEPLEASR